MATVQDGMYVCFLYTLTLDSGEVIDSTEGGEALCYVHGTGSIIPGLEQALEGMSVGDTKSVLVPAALAYGESEPDTVERLPRDLFPEDVEVGMGFRMRNEQGHVMTVYAETIGEDWVEVNFAHPLAGQDLHFEVEITEVRPATDEDMHSCGCGGCDCDGDCDCGCDDCGEDHEGCNCGCGCH
ncbi:MAG: FKBP-type peptidyl-prolyl cis-trans isomerase [Anaerolineae bacterium]|jgi:FKBP-type peptidyl-prolyl cis-trans isomerase SlyD|nr:peptidylprolyl isomerase [Chloroflexota bacterium]